jgi:hypothetical protein
VQVLQLVELDQLAQSIEGAKLMDWEGIMGVILEKKEGTFIYNSNRRR